MTGSDAKLATSAHACNPDIDSLAGASQTRRLGTMSEPRVKGTAFRCADRAFLELRGEAALAKARVLMPQDLADAFRNNLMLASAWYPIASYKAFLASFRQAAGAGPDLIRQIGARSMQIDMDSVYKRLFAQMVSPQTMLSMASRVFNTYYEIGTFEVLEGRTGFVRVQLTGCEGFDANMFTEFVGASSAMLEISGAREVRLRVISGGHDGDTALELEGRWV